MQARLLGMTAVLSGLLGLIPAGQAGLPAAQEEPVFSARSELVVLQVMVENPRGGYVTNLNSDSFSIFEDGAPQTVAFFNRQDAPVTVGLLSTVAEACEPCVTSWQPRPKASPRRATRRTKSLR
jgi:hypothetical protein